MAVPNWFSKETTAHVGGTFFHVVESPADEWLAVMERQADVRRQALAAVYALKQDPDCIEAHLLLARRASQPHVSRAHLAKAVEVGAKLWSPIAARQEDFAWWGVTATRPYMRAIRELGDWHAECGDYASARDLYGQLLEMNPNDNHGVRELVDDLLDEDTGDEVAAFRM